MLGKTSVLHAHLEICGVCACWCVCQSTSACPLHQVSEVWFPVSSLYPPPSPSCGAGSGLLAQGAPLVFVAFQLVLNLVLATEVTSASAPAPILPGWSLIGETLSLFSWHFKCCLRTSHPVYSWDASEDPATYIYSINFFVLTRAWPLKMLSILAFIAKHLFSFFSSVFLKFSVCTNDLTPKQVNVLLICSDMCIQQEPAFSGAEVWGGGNPTPLQRILGRCNHRICDSCPISVRRADILGQVADIKGAK